MSIFRREVTIRREVRNTGTTSDGLEVVDEATSPFTLDSLPRPLRQLLFLRSLVGF